MKCYFFGTFNPVHLGHIAVCDYVIKNTEYDEVIFVPSFMPPHKKTIDFQDRVNMLKLCNLNVLEIEKEITPPTYTYKVIERLGKCAFIIGYDAFLEIESWKNPNYLKENLKFLVLPRKTSHNVKEFEILKERGYNFEILNFKSVDISSTDIRQKVKNNIEITNLVTPEVKEYIYEHRLYEKMAKGKFNS